MRPKLRPRIGLALGGGAARGMAHIGVIRALVPGSLPAHTAVVETTLAEVRTRSLARDRT